MTKWEFKIVLMAATVLIGGSRMAGQELHPDLNIISIERYDQYNNLFQYHESEWIGSDVVCSIPLSSNRVLWLFGDTLLGKVKNKKRVGSGPYINNSIAIQIIGENDESEITFYWNKQGDKNEAFFTRQEGIPGDYYWPTAGVLLDEVLVIFCYAIDIDKDIGFEIVGSVMIIISNYNEEPTKWEAVYHYFTNWDHHRSFQTALYIEHPYIYFMGYDDLDSKRRAVLARTTGEKLIDLKSSKALEYLVLSDGEKVWRQKPDDLVPLFSPGNTETDIHYISDKKLYVCTTYNPYTDEVFLVTTEHITGPWSKSKSVYKIPEHGGELPCTSYAVRVQSHLSTQPGQLVISYATNAKDDLFGLFSEKGLEIYWPRFILINYD